jgi:hypothetical protein
MKMVFSEFLKVHNIHLYMNIVQAEERFTVRPVIGVTTETTSIVSRTLSAKVC